MEKDSGRLRGQTNIEFNAVRISDVTTGQGGVFFYQRASGCKEFFLGRLNVLNKEFKYRTMVIPFFDVETKRSSLKSDHARIAMSDRETED